LEQTCLLSRKLHSHLPRQLNGEQLKTAFCVENLDREIMFKDLEMINNRPQPFEFYNANDLWTNEHTSKQMLNFHLNGKIDVSSRNAEFINRSVEWICSKFEIGRDFKIADFGCGPGLYTTQLAKRGANVLGIDFSKRSIHYAQQVAVKEGLSIN
jgi:2-polyprenyl-3-methyl-5-hydroxy-6-metoxy-1,4-benzoquinol methylase